MLRPPALRASVCHGGLWISLLCGFALLLSQSVAANEQDESEARTGAERFLKVLLANPRFGTAFDRVYGFHVDRGSIAAFQESLRVAAKLPAELAPAAGTITADMVSIALPASIDPGAASMLFGMIQLRHSEATASIIALQQTIGLRPKDPVAHWYLARAFLLAQKTDDALAALEQAIEQRPARVDLLEIYKELARNQQRAQKPAEALETWKRLEAEFPGDLRVKEQIAATLASEGRWEDALARYQSLAKETKNADQRVQANLSASDLMFQLGRSQEAIAVLEGQLGDLDSDSWLYNEIRRRVETILRTGNDLSQVVVYYETWMKSHSEDFDAMARLARTLSLQNKTAEAADWYRKAITLAPSSPRLRESLIEQLARENMLAEAIAQYEAMSKFDGGNPDHIASWGQLYLLRKDLPIKERQTKAAVIWERLLENRSDDPVTLAKLASLLRRAELSDRAIALYRTAIENAPTEPQYREYLGEYLYQLQRIDDAITEWKLIAAGDRRNKANLIRLAEVLNRFAQTDAAIIAMREACSLNPDPLERVQFAEMLRNYSFLVGRTERSEFRQPAANGEEAGTGEARSGLQEEITEALEQLDLAEQSAETPDEREQILKERFQCLIAAGQLDQQIERLSKELNAGTNVTAERWRTLALYQDVAEKLNDATASAMKVVELQPDSIAGWTLLSGLYERTGRLGDAADAMQKLASLDRRGISEYLRKSARLQVRLGQFDAALATGRDMIKATPGNPDAWQFFADLAFEVGQPKIAVESLRQAVRVNPGDEASLRALAKTLADEFQTPEAIELYWRAFEKASDLESQTQIVVALSNLYLRSNQFPKLIERLELRSRELNLPTEMTRCLATAYREAGDFRKARETLEQFLIDTPNDVGLLRELLVLAQSEGSVTKQIDLQRRVATLTNADSDSENLLNRFRDGDDGEMDQSLVQEEIASARDRLTLLRIADRKFQNGHSEITRKICEQLVKADANDWEALHWLRLATALNDEERSKEVRSRILSLAVPFDLPGTVNHSGNPAPVQKNEFTPHSLHAWTEFTIHKTFGHFGAVYCDSAGDVLLQVEHMPTAADFRQVFRDDLRPEDKLRLCYYLLLKCFVEHKESGPLLDNIVKYLARDTSSAATATTLWALSERLALEAKATEKDRHSTSAIDLQQDKMEIRRLMRRIIETEPEWLDLPFFYFSRAIRHLQKEADFHEPLHEPLIKNITISSDALQLKYLIQFACRIESQELREAMIRVLMDRLRTEPDFASIFDAAVLRPPSDATLFLLLPDDETNRLTLRLLILSTSRSGNFSPDPDPDLKSVLSEPLLARFSIKEKFAIQNMLGPSSRSIGEMSSLWILEELTAPTLAQHAEIQLMLAESARISHSPESELYYLIRAAQLMPESISLRAAIVDRAAKLGLNVAALELLDSLNFPTAKSQIWREMFVLQRLGDSSEDRKRLAAKRLFALPVSVEEQQFLIPVLERLQMKSELSAVQSRLGRGTETRQSVLGRRLQTYLAQRNEQLAGEVAWELLKLASGGTLFSGHRPNDDRDDGGERLQAIKALGKLKRLQPLIDRYEAMLEASPESLDLLEILCEFHEAAEQFPQLAEKRDRIALLSKKAPPSLKAQAVALENSGDVSGACDIYLQILKDDPEAFAEEMETYVQAFERAKRHADFLTAVLSLDPELWSGNAALLINITADLARVKTNDAVVKECVEAMLANENTRRLAIGGFLARPDVVAEETLLPAIQEEIISEDAFADFSRCNETFLILQGVKHEASLKTLREFLTTRRAAGRQPSVSLPPSHLVPSETESESAGSRPQLAEVQTDLMLIYLDARLGERVEVENGVAAMIVDAATKAPSSGLTATFSPEGEKGSRKGEFGVLVLNTRLKDLGKEWDGVRLALLESLAAEIAEQDAETRSDVADSVLDELGSVYESLGQTQKARSILNQRVQKMLISTGADSGKASESIRQLLQAGEKIQHSGFPIEGARLLLNVTPHDITEFTSDLDDDKAIAFKSRFNASQRWARQQMTLEKLVTWFEMSVSDLAGSSPPGTVRESNDILLELSGVTDPRTSDKDALQRLTIESVLLNSIRKPEFTDPNLIKRIDDTVSQLVAMDDLNLPLLTVALSFSDRMPLTHRDALYERIAIATSLPITVPESTSANRNAVRVPEALRSDPDLSCVLTARLLMSQRDRQPLVVQLLNRSAAAAARCNSRLLKIAVLNECVTVAKLADLKEQIPQFEASAQAAIEEQLRSTSAVGIDDNIDLAHEIRTRLLNK